MTCQDCTAEAEYIYFTGPRAGTGTCPRHTSTWMKIGSWFITIALWKHL